ncbi:MAG: oxidoreductase [Proteobacteria bacterium]|nr:oxidoreductase [Pseudomonadota bacterium]
MEFMDRHQEVQCFLTIFSLTLAGAAQILALMIKITHHRQAIFVAIVLSVVLAVFTDTRLLRIPDDPVRIFRMLGRFAGLAGMVLYVWIFLLSQRLQLIDRWLGGLPVALRWHHRLGVLALLLLVLHPVLLAAPRLLDSIPSGLAYLFDLTEIEILTGWVALGLMLGFLLFTLVIRLPYHAWKISHYASGLAFIVAVVHCYWVTDERWAMRGVLGVLAAVALLGFFRQILWRRARLGGKAAVIEKIEVLDERTVELSLRVAGEFKFQPGQFAYLSVRNTPGRSFRREWHPFTLCSGSDEALLRFCVRNCGDDTALWQKLQPGDTLWIEGPFGQFFNAFSDADPAPQLWIAGGIGITPFLGRIRSAPLECMTTLHYFVKSRPDALFLAEFQAVARLELVLHVADEEGLPTVAALGCIPPQAQCFICGPAMMQRVFVVGLRGMGVAKDRIFYEEFSLL